LLLYHGHFGYTCHRYSVLMSSLIKQLTVICQFVLHRYDQWIDHSGISLLNQSISQSNRCVIGHQLVHFLVSYLYHRLVIGGFCQSCPFQVWYSNDNYISHTLWWRCIAPVAFITSGIGVKPFTYYVFSSLVVVPFGCYLFLDLFCSHATELSVARCTGTRPREPARLGTPSSDEAICCYLSMLTCYSATTSVSSFFVPLISFAHWKGGVMW